MRLIQHRCWFGFAVARFAGFNHCCVRDPRVALAKPRSSLGFTLTPASRAAIIIAFAIPGCARKASLHPRLYAYARFAGCIHSLYRGLQGESESVTRSNVTFVKFNFVGFQKRNELIPKQN